jgi:hypothetical protein
MKKLLLWLSITQHIILSPEYPTKKFRFYVFIFIVINTSGLFVYIGQYFDAFALPKSGIGLSDFDHYDRLLL